MAPKKAPAKGKQRSRASRKSTRSDKTGEDAIPEVYREMLLDATILSPSRQNDEGRAVKRRRVGDLSAQSKTPALQIPKDQRPTPDLEMPSPKSTSSTKAQQTGYDDISSSDASDADFEDVDLARGLESVDHRRRDEELLKIDLSRPAASAVKPFIQRRKPPTSAEKRARLDVHKWHLLCLLLHVHCRNRWCDNDQIQEILKPLVPRKLISLLHIDEGKLQYQRTHAFNKAIEEICNIWRREWQITIKGMGRAFWAEEADLMKSLDDVEDPIDMEKFKETARIKSGSRDVGAQLFCALLRSVAVDTRLVCSLQVLPFTGVAKGLTPEKPKPEYIYAPSTSRQSHDQSNNDPNDVASRSNPRWRVSDYATQESVRAPMISTKKRIKESPYPIFWVEVFDEAIQKWIPLDPLVRRTINKPKTAFEPPANDRLNSMSYVVAFEDDGSAKDVSRRYTAHYNAKTRKTRIESIKGGDKWWNQTLKFFEKPFPEDRDDIEDAELAVREAAEPMPKNVQDFKDHPNYALERHLRRNEAIHPMREVGKVSAGVTKDGKLESIYRRRDVHVVRSADQWYRRGRDVKLAEQPLKRILLRRRETPEEEDQGEGTRLYAEFQTEVYVPPAVVDGRIPKNAYGNLDVYVHSMIPPGAIHLQHPEAARAARILGVDYADAVTGFDFRGRHGTAVVNGIVAAAEFREALVELVRGIQYEQAQTEGERRSLIALQMWKKFMRALRIKERVDKEYADIGTDQEDEDENEGDETSAEDEAGAHGGGFMPEEERQAANHSPTDEPALDMPFQPIDTLNCEIIVHDSPHKPRNDARETPTQEQGGGYFSDPGIADGGGGFVLDQVGAERHDGIASNELGNAAGGFVPEPYHTEDGGDVGAEPADSEEGGDFNSEGSSVDAVESATMLDLRQSSPTEQMGLVEEAAKTYSFTESDPVRSSSNVSGREPAMESAKEHISRDEPEVVPALARQSSAVSGRDLGLRKNSESEDNTSLLSHDPDDEDATPEWLVDDGI